MTGVIGVVEQAAGAVAQLTVAAVAGAVLALG